MKKLSKNQKEILRISVSIIIFIVGMIIQSVQNNKVVTLFVFLCGYILIGYDVLYRAVRNILKGKIFDENFLMTIATIGAFVIGEYPEGIAVMIFYQVGELFQSIAVDNSRKSISELMDIRPDYANLKSGDEIVKVDPFDVNVGDIIVIKPGEKIPLDSVVIDGVSTLNTSALTGESLPKEVFLGSELLSGSVNINGVITAKVSKEFSQSTASKILELVENASNNKSKSENFISKFASVYTPIVVIVAVLLAVVPSLIWGGWNEWVYRALTFLVVSCPCALVISVPLSFFGGIGNASKKGVLVKGSNYLEALSATETIVFDKTGTLTKGVFKVQEIKTEGIDKEKLLEITAHAECFSSHPISQSIMSEYAKEIDKSRVGSVEELAGLGVKAIIDGLEVLVGNGKLMRKFEIDFEFEEQAGTTLHVAIEKKYRGSILIADEIKKEAKSAIEYLKEIGIKKTVMLTGDSKSIGEKVGKELGIDEIYSELLPTDKVQILEKLLEQKSEKGKLLFVGDGINDAPVLARADVGIAMGGVGSDSAIEASDVVLMTDELSKIADTIKVSKKTLQIVNQNIVFSLVIKIGVLILGALGVANMWHAVFADVGVSVIAILNSVRALKYKG